MKKSQSGAKKEMIELQRSAHSIRERLHLGQMDLDKAHLHKGSTEFKIGDSVRHCLLHVRDYNDPKSVQVKSSTQQVDAIRSSQRDFQSPERTIHFAESAENGIKSTAETYQQVGSEKAGAKKYGSKEFLKNLQLKQNFVGEEVVLPPSFDNIVNFPSDLEPDDIPVVSLLIFSPIMNTWVEFSFLFLFLCLLNLIFRCGY
jgi:hypothetical protein